MPSREATFPGRADSRQVIAKTGISRPRWTVLLPMPRAGLIEIKARQVWQDRINFASLNGRNMRADPAERSGYLRYFYRNWRPTPVGRVWSRAFAWFSGLGLTPSFLVNLQVRSRADGRLLPTILVAAKHQGRRYLVSMLGNESEWVQNLRAAGGRAIIKRGRSTPVMLTEIRPEERAPILKAWCRVATSGRNHLPVSPDAPESAFEAISADYPVFRIDPAPLAGA